MNKRQNHLYLIILSVILLITAANQIGNSIRILNTMTDESKVYTIFKNESKQNLLYDSGSLSLNGQELENTKIDPVSESDIPLSTVFLVDVSKTVLYSETLKIIEAAEIFAKSPVFSSPGRSRYFLQTFGDVVSQVSGPTEDPISLVNEIKYEDNTSDYYYALSEVIDFLQNRTNNGIVEKQQIILFTDATRFSETSISESQLKDKLRKAGIPVYGIVLYNTNTETVDTTAANHLLIFTEASGGEIFIPKDYSNSIELMTNEIIRDIVACYVASASMNEDFIRDPNGNYAATLSMYYQENIIAEVPYNASLFFSEQPTEIPTIEVTNTNKTNPTKTPKITETARPEEDEKDANDENESWFEKKTELLGQEISNIWIVFLVLAALCSMILIIIVQNNRKKQQRKQQEKQRRLSGINVVNSAKSSSGDKTIIARMVPSINISLIRIGGSGNLPIQVKLRENEEVKFGRVASDGVIGLDNDNTISALHFKMIYMNGFVFIEDMGSSNGVILNGSRLTQRAKVNDGDHLLLGNVTYTVQLTTPNISVFKENKK